MNAPQIARRDFLRGSGLLIVGFALNGLSAGAQTPVPAKLPDPAALDTWLAISQDGSVSAFTGRVDLGTGLETAFAQIVAEELAVPFGAVRVVMGDTDRTPDQGRTTASQGIVTGAQPLQVAAARARVALIELAAWRWKVDAASLATADGVVFVANDPSKRASYGELIENRRFEIALDVLSVGQWGPVLKSAVAPKPPAQYQLVGKSIPRVDIPAKVFGTFEYVHNLRLPGLLHARVLRPVRERAHLLKIDRTSLARELDVQIVHERDFVAVVGKREAQVVRAAAELRLTWDGGTPLPSARAIPQTLRAAAVVSDETRVKRGDVDAALAVGTRRINADFEIPCQLHAMIGPSCAVADVRADFATIWSGTQSPLSDRDDIADMLGLARDKVKLIWREASGSYGRLATDDAAADAALLSKLVGHPVRVQWMRHDEHTSEPSCPQVSIRLSASLDATGQITAIDYTQWSSSFATGEKGNQLAWLALGTAPGTKRLNGGASDISHYGIPAARVRNIYVQPWLRHVYMRSPGGFQSAFAFESIIDEAAYHAGDDPVAFRLRHLADARDRVVLTRAAELAGWEHRRARVTPAAGEKIVRGQGVAFVHSGARSARFAMALSIDADLNSGEIKLRHLVIVVDCGLIVNPDGARNQIEGAALQGLSRAWKEEVHFGAASVSSVDWRDYPILRFAEVPRVTVEFLDHPDTPPSGLGEQGTTPAAAVLANAIFDATGRRLRNMPFTPQRILAAEPEV